MIVEHVFMDGHTEAFEEPCADGEVFVVEEKREELSRMTVYHRMGNEYISTKYSYVEGDESQSIVVYPGASNLR